MAAEFDIVGFGICAVDFLGLVAKYPGPGEKVPMLAFARQGGGNTGTALVAASRFGAATAYAGVLGRDEYSIFLLQEFQKEGVDISHVRFEEGAQPPLAFIHVERASGEKRISRYWQEHEVTAEMLHLEMIENSRILFLDHYFTAAGREAAARVKRRGGKVVVDAERATAGMPEVLRQADHIIASAGFARQTTSKHDFAESASVLQQEYGNTVVITAGENGAFVATADSIFHQVAFKVQVVDTTGAGDVFHGAYMAGLLQNWPLPAIVEFAAAAAALKCRGLGGRQPIAGRQETVAFLKTKSKNNFWKSITR